MHFSFSDDIENTRDSFKIIHNGFLERDMKFFNAFLEMYVNFLRVCCLKKGDLILSESSNHTIKLMTI